MTASTSQDPKNTRPGETESMLETAAAASDSSRGLAARRVATQWAHELFVRAGVLPALILVLVVGTFLSPNFLTFRNFSNVVTTAAIVGLLAIGQGLVIVAGGAGIDLSIGATMTLAAIVAARMQGYGPGAVVAGALLTGAYVGTVNGLGVTVARLEPFIVTLGTLTMAQGAAYYLSGASPLSLRGSSTLPWLYGNVLKIPAPIVVFVGALLIGQVILSRTVFGRELYIIGGNEEAAHFAGIPVRRRRFTVYLIAGLCAGIAALLIIGQLGSADPNFGSNYNLQAIAAVVVGGTTLAGGQGSMLGTGFGVLIIALISNLLGLLNVSTYVQLIVTGLIVLVVVGLNRRGRDDGKRDIYRAMPMFGGLIIGGVVIFTIFGQLSA